MKSLSQSNRFVITWFLCRIICLLNHMPCENNNKWMCLNKLSLHIWQNYELRCPVVAQLIYCARLLHTPFASETHYQLLLLKYILRCNIINWRRHLPHARSSIHTTAKFWTSLASFLWF